MGSFSGYFVKSTEVERITRLLGPPEGVAGSPWFVARGRLGASPPIAGGGTLPPADATLALRVEQHFGLKRPVKTA